MTKVQKHKKDKIRLTRYTIEGDPIFHDLDYNDDQLKFTLDTRKDKFGNGEIKTIVCKSIAKEESNTDTIFTLTGCPNPSSIELLSISHDVDQEDYFGFELKYGFEKKNIINTKEEKLIIDLGDGNTVQVSDFQFTKDELNEIYKAMKFSNYLAEKQLSNQCKRASEESYKLTVWINSAERHYEWDECANSSDGKEMTKLVNEILSVLEKNHSYQMIKEKK